MRPLLASRWSQLQRPALSLRTIPSRRIRSFHSTRPAPFVADLITYTTDFLHGVHSVSGLPWAASIPLTAVIVRMVVAFPLQIYSRRHARKQGDIAPILFCHRKLLETQIQLENAVEKIRMRPYQAEQRLRQELRKRTDSLYKTWGISKTAQFAPLFQIPIWLGLMEGLRNMCGVNLGLLRYFMPLPDKDGHAITLPGTELTLANEGALWFPDLLAADSTGILPIMLGLSIIANIRVGFKTKTLAEVSDYATQAMTRFLIAKVLKEALTMFGVYMALTAYVTGMPAGMMIYWIASTNTATLQSRFLDKYLFASKPVKAVTPMHVRNLKPGEKPPPVKSLLSEIEIPIKVK